jgi:hypothetical protein
MKQTEAGGVHNFRILLFNPENEGDMVLRHVLLSPNCSALQPRDGVFQDN